MNELLHRLLTNWTADLVNDDSIDLMYYDIKMVNGKSLITFNVVTSYDSIVEDKEFLKRLFATLELIKEKLNSDNVTFNYNIRNSGTYNLKTLDVSNIVYIRKELFNTKNR